MKPGGVFWGFTMDARHLIVIASLITKYLHIKNRYLNLLHGKRGEGRYENYNVYYKCNTPKQFYRYTQTFHSRTVLNFQKIGEYDYYLPVKMRKIGRYLDRVGIHRGWPGSVLAMRVVKRFQ